MADSRAANEWPQVVRGYCGVAALSTTTALRQDPAALRAGGRRRSRRRSDARGGRLVLLAADSTKALHRPRAGHGGRRGATRASGGRAPARTTPRRAGRAAGPGLARHRQTVGSPNGAGRSRYEGARRRHRAPSPLQVSALDAALERWVRPPGGLDGLGDRAGRLGLAAGDGRAATAATSGSSRTCTSRPHMPVWAPALARPGPDGVADRHRAAEDATSSVAARRAEADRADRGRAGLRRTSSSGCPIGAHRGAAGHGVGEDSPLAYPTRGGGEPPLSDDGARGERSRADDLLAGPLPKALTALEARRRWRGPSDRGAAVDVGLHGRPGSAAVGQQDRGEAAPRPPARPTARRGSVMPSARKTVVRGGPSDRPNELVDLLGDPHARPEPVGAGEPGDGEPVGRQALLGGLRDARRATDDVDDRSALAGIRRLSSASTRASSLATGLRSSGVPVAPDSGPATSASGKAPSSAMMAPRDPSGHCRGSRRCRWRRGRRHRGGCCGRRGSWRATTRSRSGCDRGAAGSLTTWRSVRSGERGAGHLVEDDRARSAAQSADERTKASEWPLGEKVGRCPAQTSPRSATAPGRCPLGDVQDGVAGDGADEGQRPVVAHDRVVGVEVRESERRRVVRRESSTRVGAVGEVGVQQADVAGRAASRP